MTSGVQEAVGRLDTTRINYGIILVFSHTYPSQPELAWGAFGTAVVKVKYEVAESLSGHHGLRRKGRVEEVLGRWISDRVDSIGCPSIYCSMTKTYSRKKW